MPTPSNSDADDTVDGTVHKVTLPIVGASTDIVTARLFGAGAIGVWEQPDELVGWFADRPDKLGADLDVIAEWTVEEDRDWQAEWKATIGPIAAGRFIIVPSWLADDHQPDEDEIMIVLDPGRAFGTGHHATTAMCLELLDDIDRTSSLQGQQVADIGCGSGILGIAAAKLGASVVGVDTDPAAIAVTDENAEVNGVSISTTVGSTEVLEGPYDVVVANIITDAIAELAADLTRIAGATASAPGATVATDGADARLVVSGISVKRRTVAIDPLTDLGWSIVIERHRDGWLAALLERSAPTQRSSTTPSDPSAA
ncbi:MAG: 50S ribosomal protein L11 methyltransferase [Nitriliruptoraceae bacterium]